MSRRALARGVALGLLAAAWLRFPAAGRSQAPPAPGDPAALVRELGDPAERVRFRAMAELLRIGRPATRELARALLETEPIAGPAKRSRSDLAFAVLFHAPEVEVDALLDAYRAAPPEIEEASEWKEVPPRERILMVLRQAAVKPTERVHEALENDDPALRVTLARGLGRAGREAAEAAPWLARLALEDGHADVRTAAIDTLSQIPEGAQALRGLLGNADPQIRAAALAAYPMDAKDAAELVASSLKDPAREVSRAALLRIWRPAAPVSGDLDDDPPCRSAGSGQPAPALLADLPDSALPTISALVSDNDGRLQALALRALGSLGCARLDLAPAVAEALAKRMEDPASEVGSEALHQLARLAAIRVVPRSPEILDELLGGLAEPSAQGHADLLAVLSPSDLPEARRDEVIDALVTACLNDSWGEDCRAAHSVLSSRPAWLEDAVRSLASRYSAARSFDSQALRALEDLGEGSSALTQELERFLDHSDQPIETEVAMALAQRGFDSARLLWALAEGARSYGIDQEPDPFPDPYFVAQSPAAQTLARLGDRGVVQLIAILGDPATKWPASEAILDALSGVAEESPVAADFLLATAGSANDPGYRVVAIEALISLKSRQGQVKAALEHAFATGDVAVRSAVVWTWKETGQAPGDLLARVFSDPAPDVRIWAFTLLALLPGDDPRRLTLTAASVQDKDPSVRDEALGFAGELGEPGAALLARYAESGQRLTNQFFEGVERLDILGDALAKALEARASGASSWELARILPILSRTGAAAPEIRKRLYAALESDDPVARETATSGLSALREDPWAHGGRFAAALMDLGVHQVVQEKLSAALDMLYPREIFSDDLQRFSSPSLPRISWPPPAGYRPPVVVPRELLGATERTTLGDVYQRLVSSFEAVSHGFEHGLFLGPPGGFALVARMERIQPDGTPYPEPARWLKRGSPKLSLMDLLTDLFFERPGYFRIIVFVVTSDRTPSHVPRAVLPEPGDGSPEMPDELSRQPFQGKEVLALVYSFERQGDAKVRPWEDGAPSARQHLEKAGVWARLGTRH